ncbi:hypothetical protein ACOMHN_050195 [Nucella lapillus]
MFPFPGPTIVKNTTSADSLTETEQSCFRDTQSCQTTLTTDIHDEAATAPSTTDGPAKTMSPQCDATSCTGGYTLQCGRCLLAGSYKLYSNAKQQCSDNDGGWLVMPKTLADLQCVRNFLGHTSFRVGADDTKATGQFMWNDGTPLPVNSDLWGEGEPSSLYRSQCVRYSAADSCCFDLFLCHI